MLVGAILEYLESHDLVPIYVGTLGDHDPDAGQVAHSVHVEEDATVDHSGTGVEFPARLQLRTRAVSSLDALEAARRAYDLVTGSLAGRTLAWRDPRDGTEYRYRILSAVPRHRPNWIATPTPGQETTTNYDLLAREV